MDIRIGFNVNLGRNSTLCRNRKDGPNQVFRWNQDSKLKNDLGIYRDYPIDIPSDGSAEEAEAARFRIVSLGSGILNEPRSTPTISQRIPLSRKDWHSQYEFLVIGVLPEFVAL